MPKQQTATRVTGKPYTRKSSIADGESSIPKKKGKSAPSQKKVDQQQGRNRAVSHADLDKLRNEITASVSDQLKSFSDNMSTLITNSVANSNSVSSSGDNGKELSEQSSPIPEGQADLSSHPNAAIMELFKPQASLPDSVSSLASFDLPLGSELSDKAKSKIKNREYINLYTLISPEEPNAPFSISSPDGPEIILRANQPKRAIQNIEQWTNAMLVYAAVYIEGHPSELNAILTYINFVRSMARKTQGTAWRNYDETFRRVRESTPIPWDKPLINQYFEAVISSLQGPFRGSQASTQRRVPAGYCYKFHESACHRSDCRYKHVCFICSGRHSYRACTSKKQPRPANGNGPININAPKSAM